MNLRVGESKEIPGRRVKPGTLISRNRRFCLSVARYFFSTYTP